MQLILVLLIVGLSAYYIIRKFKRDLSSKSPCSSGCGCSGCDVGDSSCTSQSGISDKPSHSGGSAALKYNHCRDTKK